MTVALPDPALLPAALRRPVASAVALAAQVFAVLTVRYAGTSSPGRMDDRIESMVDPVGATHVWTVSRATVLGSPSFVVLAAFLLAALCLALGRRRLALLAVAGPGITGLATTVRMAERARALIPTAEAKEKAWVRAVHDDDIPNAVQESIISGFAHPAQRGLLGGYVERYFAEVAEVWERRTSERAQSVVIGLFPSHAVEKSTVDAADAFLADDSHPPALRRLVTEGRAGIVRALAAREFDRS